MKPTHLDLFSGIGGFAIAAKAAGFETIGFCEIEPYAQQILKEKFGAVMADAGCVDSARWRAARQVVGSSGDSEKETQEWERVRNSTGDGGKALRLHRDIFALNGTDYAGVSLITGGFPCQPFSVAGKRRGKEDDRAIWPQMLRVIKEARPTLVLAENVPGIINMELDNALSDLEAIGYTTGTITVPACAVDARHRRDRVWIMAHCNELPDRSGNVRERRRFESSNRREAMADSNGTGPQGRNSEKLPECSGQWTARTSSPSDVSNSDGRQHQCGGAQCGERHMENCTSQGDGRACLWLPEPDVGRVANGVPNRSHRLRALGNSIVPQVAESILKNMITLL